MVKVPKKKSGLFGRGWKERKEVRGLSVRQGGVKKKEKERWKEEKNCKVER